MQRDRVYRCNVRACTTHRPARTFVRLMISPFVEENKSPTGSPVRESYREDGLRGREEEEEEKEGGEEEEEEG